MARPTIPAGFGSGFNPAKFREAIKATMIMGLPNAEEERVTFIWKPKRTFDKADMGNNPYDWKATPETEELKAPVQVPAAVEFASSYGVLGDLAMGDFDATRARVTVLDDEYTLVKDANQVLLGGSTYDIDYWAPPQGLFEVTIYTAFCTAVDEH